jgi:nucleotide-binding universal stress UspA family protein
MVVGPRAAYVPARWEARSLVVAVDDVAAAESLAPVAITLADRFDLHLWVVQAVNPAPYPLVAETTTADTTGETKGADELIRLLAGHGRSPETKVMVGVDPAETIVRFAADLPGSLVLMGSHARSGIARIALGSVAMRVVHRAPCPVVIVRQ